MRVIEDSPYGHDGERYGYDCPRHGSGEVESHGTPGSLGHEQAWLIRVVVENQQLPVLWILVSEHDGSGRPRVFILLLGSYRHVPQGLLRIHANLRHLSFMKFPIEPSF